MEKTFGWAEGHTCRVLFTYSYLSLTDISNTTCLTLVNNSYLSYIYCDISLCMRVSEYSPSLVL